MLQQSHSTKLNISIKAPFKNQEEKKKKKSPFVVRVKLPVQKHWGPVGTITTYWEQIF